MLNISTKSVSGLIDRKQFNAYSKLKKRSHSRLLLRILILIFILFILCMFLPWTQNIRSNGYVTTLNPYDKPQNIQAQIGGSIKEWYVKEGDVVQVGDTIVRLTEAKADYLDPQILDNTKVQQEAKERSADAYLIKRSFLEDQLAALIENRDYKLGQLDIKNRQVDLKLESALLELEAAKVYADNAAKQFERMQTMYDQGIKSLTDLETKKLSNQEAKAKRISIENKIADLQNEKQNIQQEIEIVNTEVQQKTAKIESEINSADSYRYSLLGESNKLQSKFNQIEQRQKSFTITSPIAGRITKVLKNGIGEFIKEQESIATIVPVDYQKAVELYIDPIDMPLIQEGKQVRLQFDGWPAIVFSGWPDNSFGTYGASVYAIDNDISENGKYRILVIEDDSEKEWPSLIRIGSGARGLLLLNDVRVYYEIWRKLNGFPPDFYDPEKRKDVKNKAPLRKVK